MPPHRSTSRPPSSSPGPLVAPPSGPHLKRRRKGIPCKAPTPSSPTTSTSSTRVNVNMLLRALLREGEGERGLVNKRFVAPSSSTAGAGGAGGGGKEKKKEKKERDLLPPAPVGYGRGKRSVSAALAAGEQLQHEGQSRGREPTRVDRNSLQVPSSSSNGRRPPRSASTEPTSSPSSPRSSSLLPPASLAAPSSSSSMARASSAGPPSSRIAPSFQPYHLPGAGLRSPGTSPHLGHQVPPVCPSPLSTSLPWTSTGEEEKVVVVRKSPSVDREKEGVNSEERTP